MLVVWSTALEYVSNLGKKKGASIWSRNTIKGETRPNLQDSAHAMQYQMETIKDINLSFTPETQFGITHK